MTAISRDRLPGQRAADRAERQIRSLAGAIGDGREDSGRTRGAGDFDRRRDDRRGRAALGRNRRRCRPPAGSSPAMPAPSPVIQQPRPLSTASAGLLASHHGATLASTAGPSIAAITGPELVRRPSLADRAEEQSEACSHLDEEATPPPGLVADPETKPISDKIVGRNGSGR